MCGGGGVGVWVEQRGVIGYGCVGQRSSVQYFHADEHLAHCHHGLQQVGVRGCG